MIDLKRAFSEPIVRRVIIQLLWACFWAALAGFIQGRRHDSFWWMYLGDIFCFIAGGSSALIALNLRTIYRDLDFQKRWGPK